MKKKRTKSIRTMILVPAVCVLILIVFILTTIATHVFTESMLTQEDNMIENSFSLVESTLETMVKSADSVAKGLCLKKEIQSYLVSDYKSEVDRVQDRISIVNLLRNTLQQNPSLSGILFIRSDHSMFGLLPKENMFQDAPRLDVLTQDICDSIFSIQNKSVVLGPIEGKNLYSIKELASDNERYIICASKYWYPYCGEIYALAVISTKEIENNIQLLDDGRSNIYLTAADGSFIAKTSRSSEYHIEAWEEYSRMIAQPKKSVLNNSGIKMHVCTHQLGFAEWFFIRELPIKEYQYATTQINRYVWSLSIPILLLALIFSLVYFEKLVRNFDELKKALVTIEEGSLHTRIEKPFQVKEIEMVRMEFNKMSQSIEELIDTTKVLERKQLELEIKNLQTQLSPHMIFNSLTAIRWMATMSGADYVSDMLGELAEMLRPVFRDWKNEWTIGEELQHLTHYQRLLELRYGNHFGLECDVPNNMLTLNIPRFTIQPLVENACEHATIDSKDLSIVIKGNIDSGKARLSIHDNGKGINPERLSQINACLAAKTSTGGVGIPNVYNRLRICFGEASVLLIDSKEGLGTTVTIEWRIS